MAETLNVNGTQMENVTANGVSMNRVYMNGVLVFKKSTPVTDELTITPKNKTLTTSEQLYTIDVQSNTSWTVSESLGWASLSATSGTGNGTITVTLSENTSTDERSGSITFTTGDVTERHQIRQIGVAEEISITPNGHSLPASNPSNRSVTVGSNTEWEVITDAPNWFTITGGSGSGNGSFGITSIQDNSGAARSISLTIRTLGRNPASATLTISQAAFVDTLSITPNGHSLPSNTPSNRSVTVGSNADWVVSSPPSWFTVTGGSGSGNGGFTISSIQNNTSPNARSSTLTIQTQGVNPASETLYISQAADTLTLDPSSNSVSSVAQNYTIDVTSDYSWTVSEDMFWVSLSATTGSGNGTITVYMGDNQTNTPRSGIITFTTDGGVSEQHAINQQKYSAPADDTLSISPSSASSTAENPSNETVTVLSNASWSVVTTPPSWFTISGGSGTGDGSFVIDPDPNTNSDYRNFTLTVSTQDTNPVSKSFDIYQSGNPAADELSLNGAGTTLETRNPSNRAVTVNSNTDWVVSSPPNWFNISGGSGNGDGQFTIVPTEDNTTSNNRSFDLTISTQGTNPVTETLIVYQLGENLTIDSASNLVNETTQNYSIAVLSNTTWTASESLGWISVTGDSGTGDGSVTVVIEENTSTSNRDGTITFTTGSVTEDHTITQEGASAVADTLTIDPDTMGAVSGGRTYSIAITSNTTWTVSESLGWLSVSPESGDGDSSVTVTVYENPYTAGRDGIITFNTGDVTVNHTITQEGANPKA